MLRLEIVGKLISEVKFCETIKKRKISLTTLLRRSRKLRWKRHCRERFVKRYYFPLYSSVSLML